MSRKGLRWKQGEGIIICLLENELVLLYDMIMMYIVYSFGESFTYLSGFDGHWYKTRFVVNVIWNFFQRNKRIRLLACMQQTIRPSVSLLNN